MLIKYGTKPANRKGNIYGMVPFLSTLETHKAIRYIVCGHIHIY